MVNLTCNCLNVKMHLQGSSLSALDVSGLNLTSDQSSDQFFMGKIAAALLDLGGITQELLYLTKSRMLCDWTIYSCINCGIDTHAVHVKQSLNQVLVSLDLQSDPAYAASLMRSEEFSPAFRVVLKRTYHEVPPCDSFGSKKGRHLSGRVESAHNVLQQQLTRFLQKEENSTEDRIRQFRVQQKLMLEALEERSKQDQLAILRLISDNEEVQRSPTDLMIDLTPPMTPITADSQSSDAVLPLSGPELELQDKVQDIPQPMAYHRQHLQRPMRLPQGSRIPPRRKFGGPNVKRMAHSLDSDGIFELDGLDSDMPTLTNSEEDEDDDAFMADPVSSDLTTSMEIPTSPGTHPVPVTNQLRLYATSLPVSVPNWSRRGSTGSSNLRDQVIDSDDDILAGADDPDNIAASIKALARSVHNQDGTEIFGDLPRPRLNTLH